jgi:hypothetical protein
VSRATKKLKTAAKDDKRRYIRQIMFNSPAHWEFKKSGSDAEIIAWRAYELKLKYDAELRALIRAFGKGTNLISDLRDDHKVFNYAVEIEL